MNIYLSYIIIIIFASFLLKGWNKNKTKRDILVVICASGLFLIASLRNIEVGKDISNYMNHFIINKNADWISVLLYKEPAFSVLNKIIGTVTDNYQIFIAITSALILIGPTKVIYKYSKNPVMSYILYITMTFFAFSLSGLRQALAISILLWNYDALLEKKFIKFICGIILAVLFHKSVIIFLLIYFISRIEIKPIIFIFYTIVFLILFIFKAPILSFFVNNIFEQYSYTLSSSNSYIYMLTMFCVLVFGLINYKAVIEINKDALILYNMIIISVFIQLFGMESSNIVRLSELHYIFVIVFIPEVLNSIKDFKIRWLGYILIFIIVMIQFIYVFPGGGYGVVPYKFYWMY